METDKAKRLKAEILEKVRAYYGLAHGSPPFVPGRSKVPYAGRVFGPEELVNLVDSSLDFWLTLGSYGDQFEKRMRGFFGASDFVLTNSGSTANLLAVMTLTSPQIKDPLRPGDEVITCAVGFPTTVAPLVHGGLVPVFIDAEVGTYNINPGLIEEAITDKTRAIMIAHTLGIPCDMDVITGIAKRHNLYLIEDCCDALGGTFREQKVGTFGNLATLSFYPAHQITLGEGGGLVVNRGGILPKTARSIRDWGRDCWCPTGVSNTCGKRFDWELGGLPKGYDHKYIYSNIGYNFKPTDLQAAIGMAQIERIGDFVEKRRRNFETLYQGLAPFSDRLILPVRDKRANPSWFGFPVTVTNSVSKNDLVQHLEGAGIETRSIFGGNLIRQPAYQKIRARVPRETPEADRIMRDTFFIGVYPGLTEEMIAYVLETFRRFFGAPQRGTGCQEKQKVIS
ncbi:MAG: lipopolysaccharide biosynthesis protein RfbH [Candidatus Omnitrophica bacterium]|nr:lipopolysaccharide biosynthesis protein RfbH [Candidatus Omnitrophota bacterium]